MELIITINGESYKIPTEVLDEYPILWLERDEESGWDYSQSQSGFES